jgi:hypothetical protein
MSLHTVVDLSGLFLPTYYFAICDTSSFNTYRDNSQYLTSYPTRSSTSAQCRTAGSISLFLLIHHSSSLCSLHIIPYYPPSTIFWLVIAPILPDLITFSLFSCSRYCFPRLRIHFFLLFPILIRSFSPAQYIIFLVSL